MSYLNSLRLHFSGQFQADVSTVNNDPLHFNNATFKPDYQKPEDGKHLNGWWNPEGTGAWRLVDCRVTAVHYGDGSSANAAEQDSILGKRVAGSNDRVAAKLVDLDSEQQGCSEIWGLRVRLTDGEKDFLASNFKVAAFSDLWARAPKTSGDQNLAAYYQSSLVDLVWNLENSDSKFLQLLQKASPKKLSIKFNVDGFKMDSASADFTLGRIVGTIGPAGESEPDHFVLGRQLMPELSGGPTTPANGVYFTPASVDHGRGKVLVDFGNSLPTVSPGGNLKDLGELHMGVNAPNRFIPLGKIDYRAKGFYIEQAGVQEFPSRDKLSEDELNLLADNPLVILLKDNDEQAKIIVQESIDGWYVRADAFVFRMDPDQTARVEFYASRYGKTAPGQEVTLSYDNSMIGGGPGAPSVGVPTGALTFPPTAKTDSNGKAVVVLKSSDPGNPRGYIDGQVYGIGYRLAVTATYNPDPWNVLSVLVWDRFKPDDPITWLGSLQPVMQQYANLYPRMGQVLDLAQYGDVLKHRRIMQLAFGLPPEDPNYMPATRDLSGSKKEALLKWLSQPVPPEGTQPEPPAALLTPAAEGGQRGDADGSTKLQARIRHRHVGKIIPAAQLNR